MQTKIEILKACTVSGNVVTLPAGQLDRKLYQEVAQALEKIGGKWSRKHLGFLFDRDPSELLSEIQTGVKRDLKQETQFFATPPDVAEWMVRELMYTGGSSILEPSAGEGALIDAFLKENGGKAGIELSYIEKDEHRNKFLRDKYTGRMNFYHIHPDDNDFLNLKDSTFDYILANPPFSKNQDIDHIRKMWDCLKPGGRIVTVASTHWQISGGRKEKAFKKWIEDEVEATIYPLDNGRFKSSGTMVNACILVLDKSK